MSLSEDKYWEIMDVIYVYDENEEKANGLYWRLLDEDIEDLIQDLGSPALCRLTEKIQNSKLKEQLKDKIKQIYNIEIIQHTDTTLFSETEIKQMVLEEIEQKKEEFNDTRSCITISDLICIIQNVKDPEWVNNEINSLLEYCFVNIEWKPESEEIFRLCKTRVFEDISNENLRKQMIEKYGNNLTREMLKLLEIEANPNYIFQKTKNYCDLQIGIAPEIEIGLEVEANNNSLNGKEINLRTQQNIGEYKDTGDATVPNGNEIVTPIIHDNPNELSKFAAVLDTIKEVGCYSDKERKNTGGQINIGLAYLDSAESIIQFYELYGNVEELLYYISHPEGEMMRQPVYNNSRMKPFSGEIGTQIIPENITRKEVIEMFQPGNKNSLPGLEYKKNSICLRGENEENYRLEYRIPNGTVDYTTWVDNIRLIGKMVEVSKTLGDIVDGRAEPTEKQLEMLSNKESLKDSTRTLEEKLYILMDILFDDDKIKQIYTNRFYALEKAISLNQVKGQQIYKPSGVSTDSSFKMMDFQRLYNSVLENQYGDLKFSDNQEQEKNSTERY